MRPLDRSYGLQLNRHSISRKDADEVHPHLARNVRQDDMLVFKLDPEHGIGQSLDYGSFYRYPFLFGHSSLLSIDGVPVSSPHHPPIIRKTSERGIGGRHLVSTRGPPSVTATVSSKWAERFPSTVT